MRYLLEVAALLLTVALTLLIGAAIHLVMCLAYHWMNCG